MSTPTLVRPTFGGHIEARRTELKLSRRALGRSLGVTHVTIGYWESDRYLPEAGTIPLLAHALGVATSTVGRWLDDSPLATLPQRSPGYLDRFAIVCRLARPQLASSLAAAA